jgi:hypothetical protein
MRLRRTYPAPDHPGRHLGPRERAMAVLKKYLDLEPEKATRHPLFAQIVQIYASTDLTPAGRAFELDALLHDIVLGPEDLERLQRSFRQVDHIRAGRPTEAVPEDELEGAPPTEIEVPDAIVRYKDGP